MLTESDIEKFYNDFEGMKLVKPVSTMAAASGLSTGNVSEYLSRKKKPSAKFIKIFYDKIYKSSTIVPRDTVSLGNSNDELEDKKLLQLLMQQMTNLMQTQNNLLRDQKEQVVDKVKEVDTNLKRALQGVSKLVLHVESARVVVLDSLSRLEKKAPGALRKEADKIMDQLEGQQVTHGISADEGN